MTQEDYLNRKKELEQALIDLREQYLTENNIKEGDIGIDLVTKEPIKVGLIVI